PLPLLRVLCGALPRGEPLFALLLLRLRDRRSLLPRSLLLDATLRCRPGADRSASEFLSLCLAPLAAEVDDLQMDLSPARFGEELLEIALRLLDRLPAREPPPRGKAMDVRVDGERRTSERLRDDDARRLVAHARQRFELLEGVRHSAAVCLGDDLRQPVQVLRLGRREAAGADVAEDLIDRERRHRLGRRRTLEERWRDLIHLLI